MSDNAWLNHQTARLVIAVNALEGQTTPVLRSTSYHLGGGLFEVAPRSSMGAHEGSGFRSTLLKPETNQCTEQSNRPCIVFAWFLSSDHFALLEMKYDLEL